MTDAVEETSEYQPPAPWRTEGGKDPVDLALIGKSNREVEALDLLMSVFNGEALPEPTGEHKSALSPERDAVVYKTPEVTIPLTSGEIRRLTLRSLSPEEYKGLRAKFGIFYEIHEAFYRPGSGEAIQPKL